MIAIGLSTSLRFFAKSRCRRELWSDVPPAKRVDYGASRAALLRHIGVLLDELQARPHEERDQMGLTTRWSKHEKELRASIHYSAARRSADVRRHGKEAPSERSTGGRGGGVALLETLEAESDRGCARSGRVLDEGLNPPAV